MSVLPKADKAFLRDWRISRVHPAQRLAARVATRAPTRHGPGGHEPFRRVNSVGRAAPLIEPVDGYPIDRQEENGDIAGMDDRFASLAATNGGADRVTRVVGGPDLPRVLRVLLVDDHDLFRVGLRSLLQEERFKVDDASSGHAALRACRSFRPDVVLMDMNMPGMHGVEATRLLTTEHPALAVVMLTVAVDDAGVLDAIRAGACGYLLKDARLPEIVTGVRAAAAGESVLASRVAGALLYSVRVGTADRVDADLLTGLTDREHEVLALVADGLDNGEIAERLYVSPSTVKNHISRLLDKLQVENRVQAAAVAIRGGVGVRV